MANTILTPTAVTRAALAILHQKLNFVGKVNRQYDDQFAKSGAKIGQTLKIRLPNEFTVRTGKTLDVQDTTEASETLTVSTQKGVDVQFSSVELTMDLQDFSDRILEPAMSVLAANIEHDAMSMYKDVYNEISDVGAIITLDDVLDSAMVLTQALCPSSMRTLNMNPRDNRDLVDELKGLFNPNANISKQFRDGMIANQFVGYKEVYENTMWPTHTTGTDDGTGDYLTNGGEATNGETALTVDTGAGTWKKGDIFTIADVFRVHPETKASTGVLQRFVVTEDTSTSATTINFSPAAYFEGPRQNINAAIGDGKALTKAEWNGLANGTAIGASEDYGISLGYHRDAFVFATADLQMPKGVDFSAREVQDGISLRIVRDYDINNDNFPCRIDVLYGYKTVRPQLACRLGFN